MGSHGAAPEICEKADVVVTSSPGKPREQVVTGAMPIQRSIEEVPKPVSQPEVDSTLELTEQESEQLKRIDEVMSVIQKNYIRKVNSDELICTATQGLIQSMQDQTDFRVDDVTKELDRSSDTLAFLGRLLKTIQRQHNSTSGFEELVESAIRTMARSLDSSSHYIPRDQFAVFGYIYTGFIPRGGMLGLEIQIDRGELKVVAPYLDTPAYRAGIVPGDRILSVNGEATSNMTASDAAWKIRGEGGTDCTLTVQNSDLLTPREITATREYLRLTSSPFKKVIVKDGYLYVRIGPIGVTSGMDLIATVKSVGGVESVKGLVLDLRDSPAVVWEPTIEMARLFLPKNLVLTSTDSRIDYPPKLLETRNQCALCALKLAVLINKGTGGAAEIIAAAIQDHNRGLIIGSQSFGNFSVPKLFRLKQNDGLRLVTSRFYRLDGRSIEEGVTPDIEIEEQIGERRKSQIAGNYMAETAEISQKDAAVAKALEFLESEKTVPEFKAGL